MSIGHSTQAGATTIVTASAEELALLGQETGAEIMGGSVRPYPGRDIAAHY